MATMSGTPVIILKEGSERSRGRDAQRSNIMAGRAVADAVRSALGPRGMDKLLVDSIGDVVITNDGATILDEIEVQHPAAKMLVQVAKTQDADVGDGTTTAVVIAGELLKRAESLIEKKIHPTIVVKGYKRAADEAQSILRKMAEEIDTNNDEELIKVARTALNSKAVGGAKLQFSKIAVEACKSIREDDNTVDIDMVSIIQKQGKSLTDTEFIKGIVIDKEVVHPRMPLRIEDAKIALLNAALEIKKTEFDTKIRISDPTAVQAFIDEEHQMLKRMVDKVKAAGANVLICQKGIDDLAQHYLAQEKILAVRRVKKSDMEKLAKSTGGRIITTIDELSPEDIGEAGVVFEKKIGDEKLLYIEDCPMPKAVSVVIRGGSKYVTDEAERAIHDSLCVVRDVMEDGQAVAGGGAPEIEMAVRLKEFSESIGGREQLAVEAFADALEIIPKTLAENGGLDAIDILAQLREGHKKDGNPRIGVDVLAGKTGDLRDLGVIEPLRVKLQAIRSASESAELILRIDDVIASKELQGAEGGMPPGMPPGMGGMGGMGGMPPGMM
ncbi:MAG: thermosome subunit beta [Candidatus Hodarchaeales archaeon]|jgi:thermosome